VYAEISAMVLSGSLVIPRVIAPRLRASASTALVSVDSPDCEIPTTSTSRKSTGLAYSVSTDGAASETGIWVVISIRYRPNCAALSEVPRATRTTSLGRLSSRRWRSSRSRMPPSSNVLASASGC
jgi:hypothetical protein